MTFWRAQDIYQVQATLRGMVLLFLLLALLRCASRGRWWLGLGLIGVQWGLWRGLCWVVRGRVRCGWHCVPCGWRDRRFSVRNPPPGDRERTLFGTSALPSDRL